MSRRWALVAAAALLLGACGSDGGSSDPADGPSTPEAPSGPSPGPQEPVVVGASGDCAAQAADGLGLSADEFQEVLAAAEDGEPNADEQAALNTFYACMGDSSGSGDDGITEAYAACEAEAAAVVGVSEDEARSLLEAADEGEGSSTADELLAAIEDCVGAEGTTEG